jgi:MIP family channel proteins
MASKPPRRPQKAGNRPQGPGKGQPTRPPRPRQAPPVEPEDLEEVSGYEGEPPRRSRQDATAGRAQRTSASTNVELDSGTIQKGIAEMIGTFLLVIAGTGAVLSGWDYALGFGFGLIFIVYAIGHISGAHVNPAVTLGLAITGQFPFAQLPVYWAGQIIGAILASAFARLIWGLNDLNLGATQVADGFDAWQGFLLELVMTAVLVFVIRGVATDKRSPAAAVGLAIGGALLVIELVSGPVTGGSVNPARSLGPAIMSGTFGDLWIYLIAPFIGGAAGAVLYDVINNEPHEVVPERAPYESYR